MQINPEIAYQEQALQLEFLRTRNVALAQMLANVTAERDAIRAALDGLKSDLAKGEPDGIGE